MAPPAEPPAVAGPTESETLAAVVSAAPENISAIAPQTEETAVPAQVAPAASKAVSFKSKWQQDLAARRAAFK